MERLLNKVMLTQGRREDYGGPEQIQKVGPIMCEDGSQGPPPENFEILHALKCVLGASQVPFCTCIQYIPTCQLPSLLSGSSTTYGALPSGCAEVTYIIRIILKFASAA